MVKKTWLKRALWALPVFGAIGIGGMLFARRGEYSPVYQGERLVTTSGCYACHGRGDADIRVNFRRMPTGDMRNKNTPTFWENSVEDAKIIKEWIRNGCLPTTREKHKEFFIQMPAYGGKHLDEDEIDAIAAWILAEELRLTNGAGNGSTPLPALTPESVKNMPDEEIALLGDRLSRRQGCYQCHGESGQGGVQNPASFKGYIPGFFGRDFLELTKHGDPDEILHWINNGRGKAIESGPLGPIAKHFVEGQALPMPAYKDQLTEGEKSLLVRYLLLLQKQGPLDAEQFQHKIETLQAAFKKPRH